MKSKHIILSNNRLNHITNEIPKNNNNFNSTLKPVAKNSTTETILQNCQDNNKLNTSNNSKEVRKNSNNTLNDKHEKEPVDYNLSLSRYIEFKSHFDVVRKLGYLPNINSLISISEVF